MPRKNASKQQPDTVWHRLPGGEAPAAVESRAGRLSCDEADTRQERYGANAIKSGKETSAWRILLHQIAGPLVHVLLATVVVTGAIQNWADANVIAIVVVLKVAVAAISPGAKI